MHADLPIHTWFLLPVDGMCETINHAYLHQARPTILSSLVTGEEKYESPQMLICFGNLFLPQLIEYVYRSQLFLEAFHLVWLTYVLVGF